MMYRSPVSRAIVLSAISVGCILKTAHAAEKHITRDALPAPVRATVDTESRGATIKGFLTEVENGKRVFEAETISQGHARDLQIAPDGTLNEVEEEVPFSQLPAPVQEALTARAAGAHILKVESLVKHDKLVAYEASTLNGKQKGEVQVAPDGSRLKHEE
jgi:hypothetical protein